MSFFLSGSLPRAHMTCVPGILKPCLLRRVNQKSVQSMSFHIPPLSKWWIFLFCLWVMLAHTCPAILAAPPTAASAQTSGTNLPALTYPRNILTEDGQLIAPPGFTSENLLQTFPGEPAPTDISPSPNSLKKADALALYAEALTLENNGDDDAALSIFEKVVALDPDFVELRIKIGFDYLRREQIEKAADIFSRVIKDKPDNASGYTALALVKRMSKDNEEAARLSQKAIKLNPEIVAPYQYLYEIYLEQEKYTETLNLLESAASQLPDNSFFWLRLGDMYSQAMSRDASIQTAERFRKLEEIYNKALQFDPENPEILRRIGDLYINMKDYSKARDIFNRLLALYPEAARVREKLAYCYSMEGDSKMAISILESILQRNPARAEIHQGIGELRMDSEDYDLAVRHFEKSIEINQANYELNPTPDSPFLLPMLTSYLQIALVNLQKKSPENAGDILDKAEVKFPQNPRITYVRALIQRELKDYPKAIEYFELAVKHAAEDKVFLNSNFYLDYASAYEQSKNFGKAAELLKKSIELDPNNDVSLNYLGYMWADQNTNLDEAKTLIEKALKLSPNNGAYLDSLGWVYFRKGDYNEALKYLMQAAEIIDFKDDVVLDHIAQTYEKLGQNEKALEFWKRLWKSILKKKNIKKRLKTWKPG